MIADESFQFGNKKLLLVFAVPEDRCSQSKPLSYKDLTPLVLKTNASWKSEENVVIRMNWKFYKTGEKMDKKRVDYNRIRAHPKIPELNYRIFP